MNKNAIAGLFAVALVASAETPLPWIPTTRQEIAQLEWEQTTEAFVEIFYITAFTNEIGNVGQSIKPVKLRPRSRFSRSWDWNTTNELNALIADKVPTLLRYFLTNADGVTTPVVEGQTYWVSVNLVTLYNSSGSPDLRGTNEMHQFTLVTPRFVAVKTGDEFAMPADLSLTRDNYDSIVIHAPSVWFVDYDAQGVYSEPMKTVNGLNPTCPGSDVRNGFIHLDQYYIGLGYYYTAIEPGWVTLTVWYDEGRTFGTEWRWEGGIATRREIIPLKLSTPIVSASGLTFTLTGATPGETYLLERVTPMGEVHSQGSGFSATADPSGIVTWTISPTGEAGFFKARQE
ncbi:MAG TPA: hypothetical protein VJI33_03505 [Candidatus Paceibacterota bacterium]